MEWKKVTKIIFYKSVAVIYTGKNNAFLIPTEAMGAQRADILNFIEEMKNR
uniref:YcxB family protein n=1 Tax=Anaerobutyricum hallii TaxID=39488 RepID=UPI003FEF48CB